ncbi:MAG: DUF3000 domain-containing protein [Propionibacteriaceae bacterium]|nr:DUF3000 domain-containing protein [Propionibacteriaceae bacterium]
MTPTHIGVPPRFSAAVRTLHRFDWDSRISVGSLDPAASLAPHVAGLSAEIFSQGAQLASGRLILLHDPAGSEVWQGDFRCVTFAQAELATDLVYDPLLAEVGWSWLMDALDQAGASYTRESGTITTTASTPFGTKKDEEPFSQIEVRASWTPLLPHEDGLATHLDAWQGLLCHLGGIPIHESVVAIGSRLAPSH